MFTADVARLEIHHSPKQPRGSKPLNLPQVIPQFYRAHAAIPPIVEKPTNPLNCSKSGGEDLDRFRYLLIMPTG